jgi:hypothetical protein
LMISGGIVVNAMLYGGEIIIDIGVLCWIC